LDPIATLCDDRCINRRLEANETLCACAVKRESDLVHHQTRKDRDMNSENECILISCIYCTLVLPRVPLVVRVWCGFELRPQSLLLTCIG
jgi:hypothetical protein